MCSRSPSFVGSHPWWEVLSGDPGLEVEACLRLSGWPWLKVLWVITDWATYLGTPRLEDRRGISFHSLPQNMGDRPAFHGESEKELGGTTGRSKPLVSHLFLLCVLLRCKSLTVAAIRECALCGMNLIPLMTLQAYLYIEHRLAKGPTCSPRFGPRQLLHVHQGTPRQQACDSQKVTAGQGQRSE